MGVVLEKALRQKRAIEEHVMSKPAISKQFLQLNAHLGLMHLCWLIAMMVWFQESFVKQIQFFQTIIRTITSIIVALLMSSVTRVKEPDDFLKINLLNLVYPK